MRQFYFEGSAACKVMDGIILGEGGNCGVHLRKTATGFTLYISHLQYSPKMGRTLPSQGRDFYIAGTSLFDMVAVNKHSHLSCWPGSHIQKTNRKFYLELWILKPSGKFAWRYRP